MTQPTSNQNDASWKTRTYVVGLGLGAALGLLSAYLFAREVEDNADADDEGPAIAPATLLSLALSVLALVRQIAESGRKKQ